MALHRRLNEVKPGLLSINDYSKQSFLSYFFGTMDPIGVYTSGLDEAKIFLRKYMFPKRYDPSSLRTREQVYCYAVTDYELALAIHKGQNIITAHDLNDPKYCKRAVLTFCAGLANVQMIQDQEDLLTCNKLFHNEIGEAKIIALLTLMMSIREYRVKADEKGLTYHYLSLIYYYLVEMEQTFGVNFAHSVNYAKKILYFLKTFECIAEGQYFMKQEALDNPDAETQPTGKSYFPDTTSVPASMSSNAGFVAQSKYESKTRGSAFAGSFIQNATRFGRAINKKEKVELKSIRTTINKFAYNRFERVEVDFSLNYHKVNGWNGCHKKLFKNYRKRCGTNVPNLSKVSIKKAIDGFLEAASLKNPAPPDSHLDPTAFALFGADSSSGEEGEDTEGRNEAEDRNEEELSVRRLENRLICRDSQVADQGTAKESTRVKTGAKGRDDPKPDVVVVGVSPSELEEAVNEDQAEKEVTTVGDEADIMDLTQPAISAKEANLLFLTQPQEDEASSSNDAPIVEGPTNLQRVNSKGRNEATKAEAVYLTSPPAAKKKAVRKTPRKKRMICEEDLREAQKKMKGKTAVEMLEEKNIHQSSNYSLLLMTALSERENDGIPISERVAHMLAATPNFREKREMSFG
eukprot:augustus_masked-scaffold_10-processed-gene-5.66-mRNA-1 protein AED:1.00 eAED:1.00 QI:0/0/0/0/1/1/4/0/632